MVKPICLRSTYSKYIMYQFLYNHGILNLDTVLFTPVGIIDIESKFPKMSIRSYQYPGA